MGDHQSTCMQLKKSLEQKQEELNKVMLLIGPSEPLSDKFLKVLSGLWGDGDIPSDDDDEDEDPSEDQLKRVIGTLVDRSFKDDEDDGDDGDDGGDGGDEDEPEEIHHLKIVMDKAVKDKKTEQNGGGFFGETFF